MLINILGTGEEILDFQTLIHLDRYKIKGKAVKALIGDLCNRTEWTYYRHLTGEFVLRPPEENGLSEWKNTVDSLNGAISRIVFNFYNTDEQYTVENPVICSEPGSKYTRWQSPSITHTYNQKVISVIKDAVFYLDDLDAFSPQSGILNYKDTSYSFDIQGLHFSITSDDSSEVFYGLAVYYRDGTRWIINHSNLGAVLELGWTPLIAVRIHHEDPNPVVYINSDYMIGTFYVYKDHESVLTQMCTSLHLKKSGHEDYYFLDSMISEERIPDYIDFADLLVLSNSRLAVFRWLDYAKLETTGISESYENSHCIKTISVPDSYYGFALEVRMDLDTSAITFLADKDGLCLQGRVYGGDCKTVLVIDSITQNQKVITSPLLNRNWEDFKSLMDDFCKK